MMHLLSAASRTPLPKTPSSVRVDKITRVRTNNASCFRICPSTGVLLSAESQSSSLAITRRNVTERQTNPCRNRSASTPVPQVAPWLPSRNHHIPLGRNLTQVSPVCGCASPLDGTTRGEEDGPRMRGVMPRGTYPYFRPDTFCGGTVR